MTGTKFGYETPTVAVGTDEAGRDAAALALIARLGLSMPEVHLVHAIEPTTLGYAGYAGEAGTFVHAQMWDDQLRRLQQIAGETNAAAARRAMTAFEGSGPLGASRLKSVVRMGSPAGIIAGYAEEIGADLVAVGSHDRGPFGAFLAGSAGRGLVIGSPTSVLVAKGEPSATGKLRAVLATDHSEYARRCVAELIRLAPTGFASITVVTAYHPEPLRGLDRSQLGADAGDLASMIEARLRGQGEAVAYRLGAALGCAASVRVAPGEVRAVIDAAMRDTGADLLMVGAQGHGFLERLTVGSVSFAQAVAEPWPVLVLRPPAEQRATPRPMAVGTAALATV